MASLLKFFFKTKHDSICGAQEFAVFLPKWKYPDVVKQLNKPIDDEKSINFLSDLVNERLEH